MPMEDVMLQELIESVTATSNYNSELSLQEILGFKKIPKDCISDFKILYKNLKGKLTLAAICKWIYAKHSDKKSNIIPNHGSYDVPITFNLRDFHSFLIIGTFDDTSGIAMIKENNSVYETDDIKNVTIEILKKNKPIDKTLKDFLEKGYFDANDKNSYQSVIGYFNNGSKKLTESFDDISEQTSELIDTDKEEDISALQPVVEGSDGLEDLFLGSIRDNIEKLEFIEKVVKSKAATFGVATFTNIYDICIIRNKIQDFVTGMIDLVRTEPDNEVFRSPEKITAGLLKLADESKANGIIPKEKSTITALPNHAESIIEFLNFIEVTKGDLKNISNNPFNDTTSLVDVAKGILQEATRIYLSCWSNNITKVNAVASYVSNPVNTQNPEQLKIVF
jgi:hypothetical protein